MSVRKKKIHNDGCELQLINNNNKAWIEGPKRKTWSKHDLRTTRPLTPTQEDMFHAFYNNYNICAYGTAGTGKTYASLYLALSEILNPTTRAEKIILVRSVVPTRDIGFLPGTLSEKTAPYEKIYVNMLHDLVGRASTYQDMKDAGLIEFCITSFVRGDTWNNAVVIVDESQNMNFEELNSVITRLGQNCRLFVLGDTKQNDLLHSRKEQSGFERAIRIMEKMSEMSMICFTPYDIIRGDFIRSWIELVDSTP